MTEPVVSTYAQRLYTRLPDVYRRMDVNQAWLLKRFIHSVTRFAGDVETVLERIRGSRPAGPDTPVPWGLVNADELARWIQARTTHPSELGDPQLADEAWLPWLASLVGARLDPAATLAERRDTIQYATSGWRAGTRAAIAGAARSALEGSRFAQVLVHTAAPLGAIADGTMWDITVVTRASETPDPDAVLGSILRKGVKPAGAVLWTATYAASWDLVEALYPTWADWESADWEKLEETGVSYADVPDNLAPNPSFETAGTTGWAAEGSTDLDPVAGGLDAVNAARLTSGSAVTDTAVATTALVAGINDERSYHFSCSVKPHVALTGATLEVDWHDAGSVLLSTTSSAFDTPSGLDEWSRAVSTHLAPTGATQARLRINLGPMTVAEWGDVDAVLFRLI